MPAPQTESQQPQKKTDFVTLVGVGALAAVVGGVLGWWILRPVFSGDDDRPPIIVSNGSIKNMLTADSDGYLANWVLDPKNPKKEIWYDGYDGTKGKKKPTVQFDALVTGAAPTQQCPGSIYVPSLKSMTVTYKNINLPGSDSQFEVRVNKPGGYIELYTIRAKGKVTAGLDSILYLEDEGWQLVSVEVGKVTCSFEGAAYNDPRITVVQHWQ